MRTGWHSNLHVCGKRARRLCSPEPGRQPTRSPTPVRKIPRPPRRAIEIRRWQANGAVPTNPPRSCEFGTSAPPAGARCWSQRRSPVAVRLLAAGPGGRATRAGVRHRMAADGADGQASSSVGRHRVERSAAGWPRRAPSPRRRANRSTGTALALHRQRARARIAWAIGPDMPDLVPSRWHAGDGVSGAPPRTPAAPATRN